MRRVAWFIAVAAMIASGASAQPDYLHPLLRQIATGDEDRLLDAFVRVQQRSQAGIYDAGDLRYIVIALIARAEHSPETKPDIITVLGQLGLFESVPFILECAQSDQRRERLHAIQALGWIGDDRALPVLQTSLAEAESGGDPEMVEMIDYAAKAVLIKRDLAQAEQGDRMAIFRATLMDEPNWLVRADVARLLQTHVDPDGWALIMDSAGKWSEELAYRQQISAVLARRYAHDPTGFMAFLVGRSADDRLFGLYSVRPVVSSDDMEALMDIVDTDPERSVQELAHQMISELLSR
jgi:hypothetical protein